MLVVLWVYPSGIYVTQSRAYAVTELMYGGGMRGGRVGGRSSQRYRSSTYVVAGEVEVDEQVAQLGRGEEAVFVRIVLVATAVRGVAERGGAWRWGCGERDGRSSGRASACWSRRDGGGAPARQVASPRRR